MMAALIEQNAYGTYKMGGVSDYMARCTSGSAKAAAKALYEAGFRMAVGDTDAGQNEALQLLEGRVARLEGWSGMPSYYSPPGA